jgi:hypothetical protein
MGTKKFLTCVDKYQASCFPLRPCRHATNKRRPRPDRTGPSRQLLTLHLSTDFDFEARPGPSDLHARLAIPIATLLDDHVAVATAAANRDVAVAIALDALLIAERSNAVLVADTLGARRNRDPPMSQERPFPLHACSVTLLILSIACDPESHLASRYRKSDRPGQCGPKTYASVRCHAHRARQFAPQHIQ